MSGRFGDATPIIAVAGRKESDGASTFALSLALLACDRGEHVLVLDCDRQHPTLALLLPHLPPVGAAGTDGIELFGSRQDASSGGRILLGCYDSDRLLPNRQALEQRFDLILLDFGTEPRRPRRLMKEIDAEIMIERQGADGHRRALFSYPAK